MKKSIIFINLLFLSTTSFECFARADYSNSVITDPSITRRCLSLSGKRNDKISVKQRLQTLLTRNQKLQRITPVNKKSVARKLKTNESHIKHELELVVLKINRLEEDTVRQGCPGISL